MVVENQIASMQVIHEEIYQISDILKSLANPKRLNLLMLLNTEAAQTFNNLKNFSAISKTALVNHLIILEKEGLIDHLSRGLYKITRKGKNFLDMNVNLYEKSINSDYFQTNTQLYPYEGLFQAPEYMQEKISVENPAQYPGAMNSFVASITGILNSLDKNYALSFINGFSGMSFLNNFTKDTIDGSSHFKYCDWDQILEATSRLGYQLHGYYDEHAFPTYYGTISLQDIDRAKILFETVKQEIKCYQKPVALFGILLPEYGIVNGCFQDYYMVHAYQKDMGYNGFPCQFYSLKTTNYMHAVFVREKSPPLTDKDYKIALERAISFASQGANEQQQQRQDIQVTGPQIFEEWAELLESNEIILKSLNPQANAFLAKYYAENKRHCAEFLQVLSEKYANKTFSFGIQKAMVKYQEIAEKMEEFAAFFPFNLGEPSPFFGREKGAALLREIKSLEEKAIRFMQDSISMWY
ncbi:MAG: winged helix-turn-helix domain-containing protein [Promethearchaeota archaeon]